jgi:hypothetical protein
MAPGTKNAVILAVVAVGVASWILSAVGFYVLVQEINEKPFRGRPAGQTRISLIQILALTEMSPRQKLMRRCVIVGLLGFLGSIFVAAYVKSAFDHL